MQTIDQLPQHYTEQQVSALLGISLKKLRKDRWKREGLPYCKIGRCVRYPADVVQAWLDAHTVTPEEVA